MLSNATLLRIDKCSGQALGGGLTYTTGAALSGVGTLVDAVSNSQRWGLDSTAKDSSNSAYIEKAPLAAAGLTAPFFIAGDRLLIAVDDEDPAGVLWLITQIKDRQLGSMAHLELFLKPA